MSSSNSPCAACKFLRRKCTQECVFAPYFPPDQPQKFANVHKVFGASNVAKLLNELNATQRDDAVNSLAYEAEFRLRDPVYGCVGLISVLQHNLKQMQSDLFHAKKQLASYIGPQAMLPLIQPSTAAVMTPQQAAAAAAAAGIPSSSAVFPYNMSPMLGMGIPSGSSQMVIRESPQQQLQQQQQQQQQLFEAQQLAAAAAAREQQEMFRVYEQKQQQSQSRQHELLRFNEFDNPVSGFNQMNTVVASGLSPSLALNTFDNTYQIQSQQQQQQQEHSSSNPHHHQLQVQLFLQPQQTHEIEQSQQNQQSQKPEADDGRNNNNDDNNHNIGPSC